FDTISICLSKGLGTPIGTVLVGDKEIMKNVIRVRKVLGGGMRQVGFMAAAGIFALDNNVERLEEDHKKASEIGEILRKQDCIAEVEPVETNIVIFYLKDPSTEAEFLDKLKNKNIRISNMGQGKLRIVTHLDYTEEMHQRFLEVLSELYP